MKIDLKGMSRKELEALRGRVEKALDKVVVQERKAALAAAKEAAAQHGFSLDELTGGGGGRRKAGSKAKAAAKYKNPDNADQTWSGRGRRPDWFKAAIDAGKSADDLLI